MDYNLLPLFRRPHRLIDTDSNGKLVVNEDALNQISMISKDLNIVAIVGRYRTGKSYLLNRLTGFNYGFPLGSTVQSMTKGIWVFAMNHPKYEDQVLLLLDTEGLEDICKGDRNHDNWIFSLAVLLSSTLIYNSLGIFGIGELENLSFIAELSKHIRVSHEDKTSEDKDFDLFFPMFILTLRDFSLELSINEKPITSDEYLEECLRLKNTARQKQRSEYNDPRLCIRQYFKNRKCFTFSRPAGRNTLRRLETLQDDDLEKDFIDDVNHFTTFVFNKCPPKRLNNGHSINGRMFATLVNTYVETIRDGRIPCIEETLNSMAQIENRKAVEECVEEYACKMKAMLRLPVSDSQKIIDAHQNCMRDAIALFLNKAICDKDHAYQKEANIRLLHEFENIKIQDEHASSEKCQQALDKLHTVIEERVRNGGYVCAGGYHIYKQDITNLKEEYKKLVDLGCKKEEMLLQFLDGKLTEGQVILEADKMITEKEKATELEKQRLVAAEKLIKEERRITDVARQNIRIKRYQMEENLNQLQNKFRKELDIMQEHQKTILTQRLKEQEQLLREGFDLQENNIKKEVERLQAAIDESKSTLQGIEKRCPLM